MVVVFTFGKTSLEVFFFILVYSDRLCSLKSLSEKV